MDPSPLLTVDRLQVHYPGPRGPVRAVDGLSFELRPGETYALEVYRGSCEAPECSSAPYDHYSWATDFRADVDGASDMFQ